MADKPQLKIKWLLGSGIAALILVITSILIHYNRYFYAIAWHFMHGTVVQTGTYRAKLPIWWWANKNPDRYGTYILTRASPFGVTTVSSITVRAAFQSFTR